MATPATKLRKVTNYPDGSYEEEIIYISPDADIFRMVTHQTAPVTTETDRQMDSLSDMLLREGKTLEQLISEYKSEGFIELFFRKKYSDGTVVFCEDAGDGKRRETIRRPNGDESVVYL